MLFIGNGPSQVLRNAVFLFFLHFFPLMERGQRAKRLRIRDAPHRRSFSFCPSSCSSRRLAVAQRRPESIRPTISVFFFCPIDQLGVASSFSIKKKKKGKAKPSLWNTNRPTGCCQATFPETTLIIDLFR